MVTYRWPLSNLRWKIWWQHNLPSLSLFLLYQICWNFMLPWLWKSKIWQDGRIYFGHRKWQADDFWFYGDQFISIWLQIFHEFWTSKIICLISSRHITVFPSVNSKSPHKISKTTFSWLHTALHHRDTLCFSSQKRHFAAQSNNLQILQRYYYCLVLFLFEF